MTIHIDNKMKKKKKNRIKKTSPIIEQLCEILAYK
jgi:hypothetical protein